MQPKPTPTGRLATLILLLAALLAAAPVLLAARPVAAAGTFVVTRVADDADLNPRDGRCDVAPAAGDQCTLRAAIEQANATPGADTIAFNIPGPGVKRIRPTSALPIITQTVTIDGYTQPGSRPNTAAVGTNAVLRIELDGGNANEASGPTSGLRIDGANSLVRGLAIGRFSGIGIAIGEGASGTRVAGCFVGTDAGGTLDRGNYYGVFVGGANAAIGNAAPVARNIVSGNTVFGVALAGITTGGRVLGNLIGTAKTGTDPLPNGASGVISTQTDTFIGGDGAAAANTIQFNGGAGVYIAAPGARNRILRNAIGANGGLGIDLDLDGVTPNDAGDADTGANTLRNHPVIIAAGSDFVRITLNSKPNQNFFVRIYSNAGSGDEGVRFHGGPFTVTTDGSGNAGPVDLTPDPPIPGGRSVTVTATNAAGDTSEFSAAALLA